MVGMKKWKNSLWIRKQEQSVNSHFLHKLEEILNRIKSIYQLILTISLSHSWQNLGVKLYLREFYFYLISQHNYFPLKGMTHGGGSAELWGSSPHLRQISNDTQNFASGTLFSLALQLLDWRTMRSVIWLFIRRIIGHVKSSTEDSGSRFKWWLYTINCTNAISEVYWEWGQFFTSDYIIF